MRRIDEERLRALRNDLPIERALDHLDVPTARRGSRTTFRCPVCRTHRTARHPRQNLLRCFGCERSFNPLELAMAARGWSFLETVRRLEEILAREG